MIKTQPYLSCCKLEKAFYLLNKYLWCSFFPLLYLMLEMLNLPQCSSLFVLIMFKCPYSAVTRSNENCFKGKSKKAENNKLMLK